VLSGEFYFEALMAAAPAGLHITDVPRFPAVMEDLALVVDGQLPAEKVLATIMAAGAGFESGLEYTKDRFLPCCAFSQPRLYVTSSLDSFSN
jgi:hypothetical protein